MLVDNINLYIKAGDGGNGAATFLRNGQTAKAVRSLLRVVGVKNNSRVNLKIEEPEGGRGPRRQDDRDTDREVDRVVDDLNL